MSDHIVSYWTQFRRDKNCISVNIKLQTADAYQNITDKTCLLHFCTYCSKHYCEAGCEFDCIAEQNAPHFRHFATQISACIAVFTMSNHMTYTNLSLMMNEQIIAIQNFQTNLHPAVKPTWTLLIFTYLIDFFPIFGGSFKRPGQKHFLNNI